MEDRRDNLFVKVFKEVQETEKSGGPASRIKDPSINLLGPLEDLGGSEK